MRVALFAIIPIFCVGYLFGDDTSSSKVRLSNLPSLLQLIKDEKIVGDSPLKYGLTGQEKGGDTPFFLRLREQVHEGFPKCMPKTRIYQDRRYALVIGDLLEEGKWMAVYRHMPSDFADKVGIGWLVIFIDDMCHETETIDMEQFLEFKNTEIQDIRMKRGRLYFNEACITYSSEYSGKCSALVAVDLKTKQVIWRTPYLISNNIFIFWDDKTIICGYGFTGEEDYLYVVDAETGRLKGRTKLDTAHYYMERQGNLLHVFTYSRHKVFRFREKSKGSKGSLSKPIEPI